MGAQQAGGVVGPFDECTEPQEIERVVAQAGAEHDAAKEVRAVLDPVGECSGVDVRCGQPRPQLQPGGVEGFPGIGGDAAPHRMGIFARPLQAAGDRGRFVQRKAQGLPQTGRGDVAVNGQKGCPCAGQGQRDGDVLLEVASLRQQGQFAADVQCPRQVFGPLQIAAHPVEMRCGTRQHDYSSRTQVSLVPPPCDEFTTSDPSASATRVRPPATMRVWRPDSTNGRRSI